jgi:TrbL/VirB6 plasmid conjugal transfer protein
MSWWPKRARHVTIAAGVLVLVATVGTAPVAIARPQGATHAPSSSPGGGRPSRSTSGAQPVQSVNPAGTQPQSSQAPPAGSVASAPDVTEQLGGSDPLCSHPSGLSASALANCRASGSPQSAFPPGNYTPDTHIDTGLTDPGNDIASAIQSVIGLLFGLFVTVIGAALLAVSLAFGFDLFGSDHGQQIPHALSSMEHVFTLPWLPVAFAIGAIVGIVRWWGQRQEARAVGHWTLMITCAALGLLITTDPQGTAGWLDSFVDQSAMATLAGASDHNPSQPVGGYADATAGVWQQMVQTPWCAVEFGDTQWCMSRLDKQTEQWRQDVQAHLAQADSNGDPVSGTVTAPVAQACAKGLAGHSAPAGSPCLASQQETVRLKDARTNGELWLAFPSGDDARNGKNDSWTLYHHLLATYPGLAQIRGTGGVVDRLGIVALSAVGMVFFLLLVIYIAANLLLASLFFVVLLLLAPVMLLFPAFGETGKRAFWRWLGYAAGALLAKLIYALYLGVLLFASAVVGGIGIQDGGWLLEWILFAALWGLAFAYRGRMLALLSLGGHHEHHRGVEAVAATMGAVALTRAVGRRTVAQPARRLADEHLDRRDERRYRDDLTRAGEQNRTMIEYRRDSEQQAEQRLTERATGLLDARHQQARQIVARKPQILEQLAKAKADAQRDRDKRLAHGQGPDSKLGQQERGALQRASELENELTSAEQFVEGAREHKRVTGQRYTPRQLADARAAVDRELATPPDERDYEQLAYRLPGGRDAYKSATEPEKRRMREQIDRQIVQDRTRVRSAQHAADLVQAHRPVTPRQPRPRRPRPYRRYEFHGSRQHMRPQPRAKA